MVRTSSMSGRLRRVTGSLVRSAAATAGKAAFLLPLGRTRPFSRARPSITNSATTVSAQAQSTKSLALNQGFYNLCLAAERAGGQEEIVEALIERERLRALRLLRGAAKAPVDGRLRPPETLHAEEQDVNDPGQGGSGPHDHEHVSDLLGPSRRGSGSSSPPDNEIERADLAALDVPDLHHELGIEDAVTLIG